MLTALRRPEPVTIEAFDNFVSAQADVTLFELVEGVIVMMTNPTETHEQITSNIGAPLKLAMDPRGCRTYQGGIRVQRSDDARDTDKPRPDIVVRCGAVGSKTYITDPLVVVEVLSPSTIDVGRGPKLDFYKSLPTIRHIAFVYQRPDEGRALPPRGAGLRARGLDAAGGYRPLRGCRVSYRSRPHLFRRDDLRP
jgi:Uma2 family endonuclease